MSKHTPGPWAVESVSGEADHDIILGYQIPNAGYPILLASVFYDEDDRNGPGDISAYEANANARLIAAAPELLAALQGLVVVLAGTAVKYEHQLPLLQESVDKARAAIAKTCSENVTT